MPPVALAAPSPVADGVPFPLTPVQLALHTSSRLHPGLPAHGYVRQTVQGPLDTGLLEHALTALADRHTMLRLRIHNSSNDNSTAGPQQHIAPPTALSAWYEARECHGRIEDLETALRNRPFDLAAEPPVRALLARESPDLAHLVLVIHHAAGDGYSLNVLAQELWALYTALTHGQPLQKEEGGGKKEGGGAPPLPALAADFARYAAAAAQERSSTTGSTALAADLRYWSHRLTGRTEHCNCPTTATPPPSPRLP
ncbi:condensation domain-containing protein [Kitasatospora albolonga]|uniref:condensation domain-containing protein n=1 Tax=Kitasatospora albolonga TaxID=68173 RepID=UPI001FC9878E